ncbi:hypothetical protein L9F63_006130, partial [Diploptera punctata]
MQKWRKIARNRWNDSQQCLVLANVKRKHKNSSDTITTSSILVGSRSIRERNGRQYIDGSSNRYGEIQQETKIYNQFRNRKKKESTDGRT